MTQFHFFSVTPVVLSNGHERRNQRLFITTENNSLKLDSTQKLQIWKIMFFCFALTKRQEKYATEHGARSAFLNPYKILFANESSGAHLIEISCVCVQNLSEAFIHLKTFIF